MDPRVKPYTPSGRQQHLLQERERYEASDLNSSSENDQSPLAGTHTLIVDDGNSDVWDNLREIFDDIDAHGGGETKQILKEPILKLRRLLEMHGKLRAKELTLEKIDLGLRIEREWYLRKLQAIEVAIGPPHAHLQPSFEAHSRGPPPTLSFSKAIRTILYEDNEDYTLVGSKWR